MLAAKRVTSVVELVRKRRGCKLYLAFELPFWTSVELHFGALRVTKQCSAAPLLGSRGPAAPPAGRACGGDGDGSAPAARRPDARAHSRLWGETGTRAVDAGFGGCTLGEQ